MATLKVHTLDDLMAGFDAPQRLDTALSVRGVNFGVLLLALGFEPRVASVARRLADLGGRVEEICLVEYGTNESDNERLEPELLEQLSRLSPAITRLRLEDDDFTSQLSEMLRPQGADEGPKRLLFDISVASNRLVLTAMGIILDSDAVLEIAYAEASRYAPSRSEYEQDPARWASEGLTQGVGDIHLGFSHGGEQLDPLPDCLAVIPGYGRDRVQAVISWLLPAGLLGGSDQIVWLIGRPHLPEDAWRAQALADIHQLDEAAQRMELDTFDYRQTLERLESLYAERAGEHQLTLVPMGSKLQAVGVALFCRLRPDVRVVFASPERYLADGYSDGCREMWDIFIGPVRDVCERLSLIDTIAIIEDDILEA